MNRMRSQQQLVLIAIASLFVAVGATRAAVSLGLRDTNTGLSSLTISPGQGFSLNAVVSGLTTPAMATYALEIAALPAGASLGSFTETLPAGWDNFANDPTTRRYGALTFLGPEITGPDTTLVRANFTTLLSLAPGSYTIDFIAANPGFQELRSGAEVPIPYDDLSFALTVVPEPSTAMLMLLGLGAAFWTYRRRRGA